MPGWELIESTIDATKYLPHKWPQLILELESTVRIVDQESSILEVLVTVSCLADDHIPIASRTNRCRLPGT